MSMKEFHIGDIVRLGNRTMMWNSFVPCDYANLLAKVIEVGHNHLQCKIIEKNEIIKRLQEESLLFSHDVWWVNKDCVTLVYDNKQNIKKEDLLKFLDC